MKCHICKTLLETEYNYCPGCGDNLTPETARVGEAGSSSSAWVAEWEAALTHLRKLRCDALWNGNMRLGEELAPIENDLVLTLNSERRRSATAEKNHSAGSGATETPKGN